MDVKSRKRGRPKKNKERLGRELILRTAAELTLEGGKVPSIRSLAARLDADPMAVYHYFANKQELLNAVCSSLVEKLYVPSAETDWQENLMNLSLSYIKLLLSYPDLIRIFLSGTSGGGAEIFSERIEYSIRDLNADGDLVKTTADLLADYIHGFCFGAACNQTDNPLKAEMAEAPLKLIFSHLSKS